MYVVFRTTKAGVVEYYTYGRKFKSNPTIKGVTALKLFRTQRMAEAIALHNGAEYDTLH